VGVGGLKLLPYLKAPWPGFGWELPMEAVKVLRVGPETPEGQPIGAQKIPDLAEGEADLTDVAGQIAELA
jgi:hypothetical protein